MRFGSSIPGSGRHDLRRRSTAALAPSSVQMIVTTLQGSCNAVAISAQCLLLESVLRNPQALRGARQLSARSRCGGDGRCAGTQACSSGGRSRDLHGKSSPWPLQSSSRYERMHFAPTPCPKRSMPSKPLGENGAAIADTRRVLCACQTRLVAGLSTCSGRDERWTEWH